MDDSWWRPITNPQISSSSFAFLKVMLGTHPARTSRFDKSSSNTFVEKQNEATDLKLSSILLKVQVYVCWAANGVGSFIYGFAVRWICCAEQGVPCKRIPIEMMRPKHDYSESVTNDMFNHWCVMHGISRWHRDRIFQNYTREFLELIIIYTQFLSLSERANVHSKLVSTWAMARSTTGHLNGGEVATIPAWHLSGAVNLHQSKRWKKQQLIPLICKPPISLPAWSLAFSNTTYSPGNHQQQ